MTASGARPATQPGTLDLTAQVPLLDPTGVLAAREACDQDGHPPTTYNPWHGTYCRCGIVVYPGNHAPAVTS